jgi:hypothetical protein
MAPPKRWLLPERQMQGAIEVLAFAGQLLITSVVTERMSSYVRPSRIGNVL